MIENLSHLKTTLRSGFFVPMTCLPYSHHMNIKKRLTISQIKRHALLTAGISPNVYGQKKSTKLIKSRKTALVTRGQKHKHQID